MEALRSGAVGEAGLAADLEQKYCSPRPVLPTPVPPQLPTPLASGMTPFSQYPLLTPPPCCLHQELKNTILQLILNHTFSH